MKTLRTQNKVQTIKAAPDWPVVSQDPCVAPKVQRAVAEAVYLPVLIAAWQWIEKTTGFRWHATSYWRKSPSHITGQALDLAPDIAPSARHLYSVFQQSDPVLYKRLTLMRSLQQATLTMPQSGYTIGIFVEPDHLHVQLFNFTDYYGNARLFKWKQPKAIYPDTYDRINLPMLP